MTRKLSLSLLALALAGCATAPATQPEPSPTVVPELSWDQVDQADGQSLYTGLCASCHGPTGLGDGPVAATLTMPVPDLTLLSEANGGKFPLARVEDAIRGPSRIEIHGGPQMPLWGPALEGVFDDLPRVNREAFAASRVRRLSRHLESLQVGGTD